MPGQFVQSKSSWLWLNSGLLDASECASEPSGMGTMALLVQMWIAFVQSRPSMQPPLTESTFFDLCRREFSVSFRGVLREGDEGVDDG